MAAIGFPASEKARHLSGWIWWTVLAVVTIGLILAGGKRSVVHNYIAAGDAWSTAAPLYNETGDGFIYLPHLAILFAPLAHVPTEVAEVIWRILALSLFASGVYRLCRVGERELGVELFLTTTLITLPLSWSAAQNGQATLPMAGLMMHAIADVWRQSWNRSALWLWLAVGIKPLAVVLLLLIAATKPKSRRPLIIGAFCFCLLPFLAQRTPYVWQQMCAIPHMLTTASGGGQTEYWAQLFGMLEVAGLSISPRWQFLTRVGAALATLGAVVVAERRLSKGTSALVLYALAATYIMLFSPRTENNTYAMVAPAIALFFALEADFRRRFAVASSLLAIAAGTVCSFEIGRLFTPREQSIWLAPVMAVCFAVYLARQSFSRTLPQSSPNSWCDEVKNMSPFGAHQSADKQTADKQTADKQTTDKQRVPNSLAKRSAA